MAKKEKAAKVENTENTENLDEKIKAEKAAEKAEISARRKITKTQQENLDAALNKMQEASDILEAASLMINLDEVANDHPSYRIWKKLGKTANSLDSVFNKFHSSKKGKLSAAAKTRKLEKLRAQEKALLEELEAEGISLDDLNTEI